jgi:hypothetical protein
VTVADYLGAPGPARGMAYYNLGCARAQAQSPDEALGALRQAIGLNPDLVANLSRDTDLAVLRASGQLDSLAASR